MLSKVQPQGWAHRDGLTLWSVALAPIRIWNQKSWDRILLPPILFWQHEFPGPRLPLCKMEIIVAFLVRSMGHVSEAMKHLFAVAFAVWVGWGSEREHE